MFGCILNITENSSLEALSNCLELYVNEQMHVYVASVDGNYD